MAEPLSSILDFFTRNILGLGYAVHQQTYTQARQVTMTDYGVDVVTWATMEDLRVCPFCEDMNGHEFNMDDAPTMPAHNNCRCRLIAKPI